MRTLRTRRRVTSWAARLSRLDRRELLTRASVIAGVWGLSVAQPLLDLFGNTPEFFVANRLDGLEIVLFVVALAFLGPFVLTTLVFAASVANHRVGQVVFSVIIGLLVSAFVVGLLTDVGGNHTAGMLAAGLVAGVAAAWFLSERPDTIDRVRFIGVLPLLFLAAFWLTSPSGDLLGGDPAANGDAATVSNPVPVVLLTLDELPTASLLDADGEIDESIFPNFARLGDRSTFHRSASSVVSFTTGSLPTILTGLEPEGAQSPTARDHPRSIFTLLEGNYQQNVLEQSTDVCPDRLCTRGESFEFAEIRSSLADSLAVYAQVAVPPALRNHFPAVDQAWGGFIDNEDPGTGSGSTAPPTSGEASPGAPTEEGATGGTALRADPDCPDVRLDCGPARFVEFIESIEGGAANNLHLAHVTTPHFPWTLSPSGDRYLSYDEGLREFITDRDSAGLWPDDPDVITLNLQRHLYQVGAVDTLLGQLIDRLEETGLWDQALVMVVADHGVSFTAGTEPRTPTATNLPEIYNVPIFVKAPGQTEGAVLDDNALTLDIVPTVVDVLGITTPWEFDGQSLVDGQVRRPDKPVFTIAGEETIPTGSSGVLGVAQRNASIFGAGEGWARIASVGPFGSLIGTPIDELDAAPSGETATVDEAPVLADWNPDSGQLAPIYLHGVVPSSAGSNPTAGLVAVNGRVAGTAITTQEGQGTRFRSLLDESALVEGANEVVILLPAAPGSSTFLAYQVR